MNALDEVLKRLLTQQPDIPEPLRDEIVRAGKGGHDELRQVFHRGADEALRLAEEHHRRLVALIRRP